MLQHQSYPTLQAAESYPARGCGNPAQGKCNMPGRAAGQRLNLSPIGLVNVIELSARCLQCGSGLGCTFCVLLKGFHILVQMHSENLQHLESLAAFQTLHSILLGATTGGSLNALMVKDYRNFFHCRAVK
jgi:hypothetical protein